MYRTRDRRRKNTEYFTTNNHETYTGKDYITVDVFSQQKYLEQPS
jgi:hypothetical protein